MRRKPKANEKTVHKFIYMAQTTISNMKKKYTKDLKLRKLMDENGAFVSDNNKNYYQGYKDGLKECQKVLHKLNVEFSALMKEHDEKEEKKPKKQEENPLLKLLDEPVHYKEVNIQIRSLFMFPNDKGATVKQLLDNEMTKELRRNNSLSLVFSPFSYKKYPHSFAIISSTQYNCIDPRLVVGTVMEIDLSRYIIKVRIRDDQVEHFFDGKFVIDEWEACMRVIQPKYKMETERMLPILMQGRLLCFDLVKKET